MFLFRSIFFLASLMVLLAFLSANLSLDSSISLRSSAIYQLVSPRLQQLKSLLDEKNGIFSLTPLPVPDLITSPPSAAAGSASSISFLPLSDSNWPLMKSLVPPFPVKKLIEDRVDSVPSGILVENNTKVHVSVWAVLLKVRSFHIHFTLSSSRN